MYIDETQGDGPYGGKRRGDAHAVKTATVCAITSPKLNTLRQIFQFCDSLRQRGPSQNAKGREWPNAPMGRWDHWKE